MIRIAAAVLLAAASGSASPLAGRIAGPARQCVDLSQLEGPSIEQGGIIIYRQSGKRWWVVRPVGACPALRPLTTLIIDIYGGQLCRNDRFRVAEPGLAIASGYCRFGNFVPYDKP